MTSIAVIGSVNLDLSASVRKLPAPGETGTDAVLERFPGGKGANQALAAARLGADVSLVACVGDDAAADEALDLLRAGGVNLDSLVIDPEAPTGTALIAVATSGENQIVVAPGANRRLLPDRIDVPTADALICQLEVPGETIAYMAAHYDGMFCANLAPAREVDVTVLQRADLLVVNETEADWYGNTLAACDGLIAKTFGARGAVLEQGGSEVASAAAPAVVAVDTTGAGDCFTAALALALVEGQAPDAALAFACAAGSAATTRRGAQPSLPARADVEALLGD